MTLSERFKSTRLNLKLTQQDLAENCGVTREPIHRIEDETTSRPRNIEALAKLLQVSPAWLQFGEGINNNLSLSKPEIDIVELYNQLTEANKKVVTRLIKGLLTESTQA